jgi:hypothetical protein
LKLLLDEMYPHTVAEGLRSRGHDAVAVVERPELRAAADADVFAAAQREQRAVVTENVADFVPIALDHDLRGVAHYGLVLVHPRTYPRGDTRTIGRMVIALAELATRYPGDEPSGMREWV